MLNDRNLRVVISYLQGGLGNQMFQYAVGRALSSRSGCRLSLDTSSYSRSGPRQYALNCFNIKSDPVSPRQRLWLRISFGRNLRHCGSVIRRVAPSKLFQLVEDDQRGYIPSVLSRRGRLFLRGYWQSERYFAEIRDALCSELSVTGEPDAENRDMLAKITSTESVCVHVRRGDYLSDSRYAEQYVVQEPSYYGSAAAKIRERTRDPHFFVFADDPLWARHHLKLPGDPQFVTHNMGQRDHEDFRLMAACRHFIIANSSFSWWAAWLGRSPGKLVIAPRLWRRDVPTPDIVPLQWERV